MPTGSKIKEIRQQKGLTQKQLGDLCGMADSAIRRYENGKANPKIETLQKIADALDVPLDYLLGWEDKFNESPLYRALKRSGDTTSCSLYNDYIQRQLTMDIHWEPIDIEMVNRFKLLNPKGQAKAIDQVDLLTKIPEYRKEPFKALEPQEPSSDFEPTF